MQLAMDLCCTLQTVPRRSGESRGGRGKVSEQSFDEPLLLDRQREVGDTVLCVIHFVLFAKYC